MDIILSITFLGIPVFYVNFQQAIYNMELLFEIYRQHVWRLKETAPRISPWG